MTRIRKKKITAKLIENKTRRKACYKRRLKGLFTKMEHVTILCGIEACAVVFGPGDTKPSIWPSPAVAEDLITKFESMSLDVQSKNKTDQLTFLEDKGKKLEASLDKINKENEETLMGAYLHQIENEGKSLDDFDHDVHNRLIAFTLEKIKITRKMSRHLEKEILPLNNPHPPLAPISFTLDNGDGVHHGVNMYKHVLNQQPLSDLVEQVDQMSSGVNNNPGSSMGIPPLADLGGDLANQADFGGFGNGMGIPSPEFSSGGFDAMFFQDNLENFDSIMGIPSHENHSGSVHDMFLPRGNQGHFINNIDSNIGIQSHENPSGGVGVLPPQGYFGGQNNFQGFDDITGSNTGILPDENLNGNADSLPAQENFEGQENFGGFDDNTGSGMWLPHSNSSGGDTLLPQENFGGQFNFEDIDNNTGNNMLIPPHSNPTVGDLDVLSQQGNFGVQENFGGFDDNTCSNMWKPPHENPSNGGVDMMTFHQNNFGGNINGDGMWSFNANFVDNNYGSNFNPGFPSE